MLARRFAGLIRTLNTLRYLKPVQLFYFVWRRGIGARRVQPMNAPAQRQRLTTSDSPAEDRGDGTGTHRFTFLNRSLELPGGGIDWCPSEVSRLWRYNLHYFDYLSDADRPLAQKIELLDSWIEHNPQGTEPAWEPYTASLRIVNWCKFFASLPPSRVQRHWLDSLYEQALWLEKNLELHILANHYFENIKALLFAGALFDNTLATRWLEHFQRELREQLREQFLTDGGHYERTPQYHYVLLDDLLDLLALAQANPSLFDAATPAALRSTIEPALTALAAMQTPDRDIPQFNDSASGTVDLAALWRKAGQLGFAMTGEPAVATLVELPMSGLYGWRGHADYFLIDCGDIGPSYQPGHTHCDFLSYVLMLDDQWLVVDSGVFEYEPGAMRQYVRSTAAHSTIAVGGQEQSEVWGEFRVARRARRVAASIEQRGHDVLFEGAYRGFPRIRGGIEHRRRAALQLDDRQKIRQLAIDDDVAGSGRQAVASYIQLHPSIRAVIDAERVALFRDDVEVATIVARGVDSITANTGWYCPQFGIKQANTVLVLNRSAALPLQFGYTVIRSAAD